MNRRDFVKSLLGACAIIGIPATMLYSALKTNGYSRELRVGKGEEYPTIREALEAARDGDIVLLCSDVSEGDVVIAKCVTIQAADWEGEESITWRPRTVHAEADCMIENCIIENNDSADSRAQDLGS